MCLYIHVYIFTCPHIYIYFSCCWPRIHPGWSGRASEASQTPSSLAPATCLAVTSTKSWMTTARCFGTCVPVRQYFPRIRCACVNWQTCVLSTSSFGIFTQKRKALKIPQRQSPLLQKWWVIKLHWCGCCPTFFNFRVTFRLTLSNFHALQNF